MLKKLLEKIWPKKKEPEPEPEVEAEPEPEPLTPAELVRARIRATENILERTRQDFARLAGHDLLERNGAYYEVKNVKPDKGVVTLRAMRKYQIEDMLRQNPEAVEEFALRLREEEGMPDESGIRNEPETTESASGALPDQADPGEEANDAARTSADGGDGRSLPKQVSAGNDRAGSNEGDRDRKSA